MLVKIAWMDLTNRKIANRDVLIIGGLSIIQILCGGKENWVACLAGSIAVALPMLVLAIIVPGSFGGGDIKLMMVCGALLGVNRIVKAFISAIFLAGGYGMWLLIIRKKEKKSTFAFGPFLCMGMVLASIR